MEVVYLHLVSRTCMKNHLGGAAFLLWNSYSIYVSIYLSIYLCVYESLSIAIVHSHSLHHTEARDGDLLDNSESSESFTRLCIAVRRYTIVIHTASLRFFWSNGTYYWYPWPWNLALSKLQLVFHQRYPQSTTKAKMSTISVLHHQLN